MPARTLNDFFAGFFAGIKADMEVKIDFYRSIRRSARPLAGVQEDRKMKWNLTSNLRRSPFIDPGQMGGMAGGTEGSKK
jgi:hypothetical protein